MIGFIATQPINLRELIWSSLRRDEGQDMIEYALLAGLISIFCVAAIVLLSPQLFAFYHVISNTMKTYLP